MALKNCDFSEKWENGFYFTIPFQWKLVAWMAKILEHNENHVCHLFYFCFVDVANAKFNIEKKPIYSKTIWFTTIIDLQYFIHHLLLQTFFLLPNHNAKGVGIAIAHSKNNRKKTKDCVNIFTITNAHDMHFEMKQMFWTKRNASLLDAC